MVPIDSFSFKDVLLELLFNYFSAPLSVHEHKTIKGYLIGITWDCLVNFKGRYKYVVPVLEAELLYLYRYLRQRTVHNNSASSSAATDVIKNLPIFPSSLSTGVNL